MRGAVVVGALFCASQAGATPVAWTGPSDGDTGGMVITFAGLSADTLTVSGGYMHDHGSPTTFGIDLRIDGIWTTVTSFLSTGSLDDGLQAFGGPISFSAGIVDGISFTDTPSVFNGYHCMGSDCGYGATSIDLSVTAVPEPETYAMLLAGLGLLGYAARRRKQKELAAA